MNRTQRALEFCIGKQLFTTSTRSLVVSGGVANNDAIFEDISHLAKHYECKTYRPSKQFCSDNGVMIAWNAIEQILHDEQCLRNDYYNIDIQGKATLGVSLIDKVTEADIKCKWIKTVR